MAAEHIFPLFVGDFLGSTLTWRGPEKSLYLLLLAVQWASGALPADIEELAGVVNYPVVEFMRWWPKIAPKFTNGDGKLRNQRLEKVRTENAARQVAASAKASRAAAVRWSAPRNAPSKARSKAQAPAKQVLRDASDPIRSDPKNSPDKPVEIRTAVGAKAPAKTASNDRGTRIPEPFEITEDMRAWAKLRCPKVTDLASVTEEFVDYWRGIPGTRGRKLDWPATWRSRMLVVSGQISRGKFGSTEKVAHKPLSAAELEAQEVRHKFTVDHMTVEQIAERLGMAMPLVKAIIDAIPKGK